MLYFYYPDHDICIRTRDTGIDAPLPFTFHQAFDREPPLFAARANLVHTRYRNVRIGVVYAIPSVGTKRVFLTKRRRHEGSDLDVEGAHLPNRAALSSVTRCSAGRLTGGQRDDLRDPQLSALARCAPRVWPAQDDLPPPHSLEPTGYIQQDLRQAGGKWWQARPADDRRIPSQIPPDLNQSVQKKGLFPDVSGAPKAD